MAVGYLKISSEVISVDDTNRYWL